jgi:hypothetical protein
MNGKLIKLTEFQDRVHDWSEANYDLRADSKEMLFHDVEDIEVFEPYSEENPIATVASRLTLDDHSKGQLCERFSLPKRFMFDDKYFDAHQRKLDFEYKFKKFPQEEMLIRGRTLEGGDQCRAVLTKHYRPYDNHEFIDSIVEAVKTKNVNPNTIEVGNWSIGSEMRGFGILPHITFDQWGNGGPPSADGGGSGGLHPGFKFGNSEIGSLRIRIAGGGWRGYCNNGMIYGWNEQGSFAQVHRGQKVMSLLVNEAIADALLMSERGAQKYIEKMSLKVERTDIGDIISDWSTKYGFTIESTDTWTGMVMANDPYGQITEFDMINDLTYVARGLNDNVEEQELLQRTAGDMVFHDSIETGLRIR